MRFRLGLSGARYDLSFEMAHPSFTSLWSKNFGQGMKMSGADASHLMLIAAKNAEAPRKGRKRSDLECNVTLVRAYCLAPS